MEQGLEISKLDQILEELDVKINEFNAELLDIVKNIKLGIYLSQEKKKKGLEVASIGANVIMELQGLKESNQIDKETAKYAQVGAGILTVGALIYSGFTHLREKSQVLDYLKEIKKMEGQQAELIRLNYDKIDILLKEIHEAIQTKILKTVDYLSKFELKDSRAIEAINKLHKFVIKHTEYSQKYHAFYAYKIQFDQYIEKTGFSLDIPIEAAETAKANYLKDISELLSIMNKGDNTVGDRYLLLNHKLFTSDIQFNKERKALKGKSIREIAYTMSLSKKLPQLKGNPLHKTILQRSKEIIDLGAKHSATTEKLSKAVKQIALSAQEYQKKGNVGTERLLLDYIQSMTKEQGGLNKDKVTEFDMKLFEELVRWYDGISRTGKGTAITVSIIFAAIAFFVQKWLLLLTPLVYWFVKRATYNQIAYSDKDKRRLEERFGKNSLFYLWMIDRLDRHDMFTNFLKFFKS